MWWVSACCCEFTGWQSHSNILCSGIFTKELLHAWVYVSERVFFTMHALLFAPVRKYLATFLWLDGILRCHSSERRGTASHMTFAGAARCHSAQKMKRYLLHIRIAFTMRRSHFVFNMMMECQCERTLAYVNFKPVLDYFVLSIRPVSMAHFRRIRKCKRTWLRRYAKWF